MHGPAIQRDDDSYERLGVGHEGYFGTCRMCHRFVKERWGWDRFRCATGHIINWDWMEDGVTGECGFRSDRPYAKGGR